MQFRPYVRLSANHFDLPMQTLRVVVESYRSDYDGGLHAFRLFRIFFARLREVHTFSLKDLRIRSLSHRYFHPSSAPEPSYLHVAYICIVDGIIACVESINIVFHGLIDIVASNVINEAASVGL